MTKKEANLSQETMEGTADQEIESNESDQWVSNSQEARIMIPYLQDRLSSLEATKNPRYAAEITELNTKIDHFKGQVEEVDERFRSLGKGFPSFSDGLFVDKDFVGSGQIQRRKVARHNEDLKRYPGLAMEQYSELLVWLNMENRDSATPPRSSFEPDKVLKKSISKELGRITPYLDQEQLAAAKAFYK